MQIVYVDIEEFVVELFLTKYKIKWGEIKAVIFSAHFVSEPLNWKELRG